ARVAFRRARVRHALGSARQDDPRRFARADFVDRRVRRPHLRIHVQLAKTTGDELCVLRSEVEDENCLMGHCQGTNPLRGIIPTLTTRCCSAIALTTLCIVSLAASREPLRPPLGLFPERVVWTLALNAQLSVPPIFTADRVVFGLDGDRFAGYSL